MVRKIVLAFVILCLLPIVNADIDGKINSVVKYGEQYEMGQISYLQMIVYSNILRHDINDMLSEKIEININGPVEYGATEEEMRRMFGAPIDISPWVWVVNEEKEMRIDERMPHWEKTVFDGKKLKITFNAWPNVIIEDDGSLTKFYWIDFDTRFKRKFDFNTNSMISDIKNMAESFLETDEGGKELAERMVEYRNILHHYLSENRENCIKVIKEFFDDDEKISDMDVVRWDTHIYEGDNLELTAEVISCDGCEWPGVNIWFNLRMRDIRSKEVDMKYKKYDKEKYRAMTIDELNSLIDKNVERLVRKAEQDDRSKSGNIMRDMVKVRSEIRIINQVLDEKYYWGIEEKEGRQENYEKRMRVLESIFSKYGDIDMYPLEQVLYERRILEKFEERKDSWCRELKQDECSKDDVCWEGECINAVGGNEICDNEKDDDGDHAVDCDDPDCSLECGTACDYICSKECGECHQEQCWGVCEDECWPCYNENRDNMGDSNPCESVCGGCDGCIETQCQSQPVCDKCNACRNETYKCFDVCSSCNDCRGRGLIACTEECKECDLCKATDTQRECMDFCETLGEEGVGDADPNVRNCKELCRQDVVFICPTGKQYTPCKDVYYVCDGNYVESVPCLIYECGDIKQTAPCGQEIMCGQNQYADVDKCLCIEGFYDCDDITTDCEATRECHELIEKCDDKIDNDEDSLTDCEDLQDCRTGSFCGQGPADEPIYCYEGECTSTTCGNGICGSDETMYSCPPDCPFTKPVCGDEICSGNETEESCPEDCLICPEGQIINERGICVDPVICPIGYTNVNGTCVPPKKCIKEGKIFDKMDKPNATCCEDLTKLDMAWPSKKENVCIATSTWEQTCTKCGDGDCGKGENWCICPEDCPIPVVNVSCIIDADCGADFCSQKKDVCHGTTYACLEGNCSSNSTNYENFYCIDSVCIDSCGNGICEPPETDKYCPEDCGEVECISNNDCGTTGCSGQVCARNGEQIITHCAIESWFRCLELSNCGCYDDKCKWEENPDYLGCRLEELCGNSFIDLGENCENCPQDAACRKGFSCRNKECIPINITCAEGQELNDEGECVDICGNRRIDDGEDCESCPSDVICMIGYVCENKECSPVAVNITCEDWQEINEDGECVDICGNGRINKEEDCESCPSDVICELDYVCENKECVPVPVNITCPKDQELNDEGECVDICGNGRIDDKEDCESCPSDVICRLDYVCENKKCVPGINITCPDGYVLNNKGECVKECLKEGEFTMEFKDCCPDLKAMSTQVGDGRTCSLTAGYVCTALCGDEKCEGLENPCNCRKDCKIPEEVNVSCITNADCGTDTCHQGRNVCSEHIFVCEEGECSAVSTDYDDYSCARYYSPELPYPENIKCLDTCGDGVCKRPENKNWCTEDCKEKELCGNKIIDPEENCENCPKDVACEKGFSCENKECVPKIVVCPEGMEPNEVDQCVDICGNGRIDDDEDCSSCPKDVSCSDDFICENKECIPEEITCPDGYVLSDEGTCELIIVCKKDQQLTDQGCIPIEDDCRQDDDCVGKEECKAGVCVAPPRPRCESDEECPPNKMCDNGICIKNIDTHGPTEPELTGEECILVSDCSGENDICSNGECKEIPEEFIEEEEEELEEEEPEEEKEKRKKEKEEPEEVIEEEKPEEEEEEEEEPEPEPVEEEKPEEEEKPKKEPKEEKKPEPEPVEEEPEPEPEITGESVLDTITGFITNILGFAIEDGCREDSDCNQNQNCDNVIGECHCKEYFFDCNSRTRGNDEDGCESQDPTCGGERELCKGGCNENQYCDEERGNCMCNEGFWECDGYWQNGCESEERCGGCEDDSDCMRDICAPGDMRRVINFGCVQGSTWKEEKGTILFGGGCNFLPTERVESYMGFNAWGESFDQVQWYQEATEQLERHWCEYQLEHLVKQRIEMQESYNQEFLVWFFEEYVNSNPDKWDKYSGGIYDVYWKFVDNSRETNRHLRCLNLNKFPSEYEMVDEIEYESENGYVKFWEEKAIVDGVEIFSPYMEVWVFPPKEFLKENFRTSMEKGVMPGPPEEGKPELSPSEIKKAKEDKKFMEKIRDISDDFGGSADFLITVNDDDEILYKAMITINPEIIFKFEVKNIDREPDVTVSIDFDFLHGMIATLEKERDMERPPWDRKPMGQRIKGTIDKGAMLIRIAGAIATGKIKVSPISQIGKVLDVLGFLFDQGPKQKGPKDDKGKDEKKD